MTSGESFDSNASEADGIRMEIMVPDIVALAIPENKPGAIAPVHLVVEITNNTSEPFSASLDDTFIPELVNSDGQSLQGLLVIYEQEPTNQSNISQQQNLRFKLRRLFSKLVNFNRREDTKNVNSWLVQPGRYRDFRLNGRLFWQNDLLILELSTKDFSLDFEYFRPRSYYSFPGLQPGNYQLRFIYFNKFSSSYNNQSDAIKVINLPEIASSHPTAPFINFRLIQRVEPNSSAVEVDGIRFETLVPEQVLAIPEKKSGVKVNVQLGICITNNTPTPLCFSFYTTLKPELLTLDGQILQGGYSCYRTLLPKESDLLLGSPGGSVTFFPEAQLFWLQHNQLTLSIAAGDGGSWDFKALKPGTYQVRFTYNNKNAVATIYGRKKTDTKLIKGLWTGMVSTPFVEFRLVQL